MEVSFSGFKPNVVQFYKDLSQNNNREWFEDHKKHFKKNIEEPGKSFANEMTVLLSQWMNREVHSKLFRIYRDVRFSKDKTPYNPYLRIAFYTSHEGVGCGPAFYFSLDAAEMVVGAGQFQFEKEDLEAYRNRLSKDGAALNQIFDDLKSKGLRIHDPQLKRIPKGVDPESPIAHLYKYKGIAAWKDQKADLATAPSLCVDLMTIFEDFKPLVSWLGGD